MTVFNETTNLITTNAIAVTMANGDELFVAQDVVVAADTTAAPVSAVSASGSVTVDIDGMVSGSLDGFLDTVGFNFITIGATGTLETQNNQLGSALVVSAGSNQIFNSGSIGGEISISGTGANFIQNSGLVQSEGYGIILDGISNTVSNTGTILGGNLGSKVGLSFVSASVGDNVVSNSGTISGGNGVNDFSVSGSTLSVTNDGTVNGFYADGIAENNHGNLDVQNTGKITGNTYGVVFGGGTGTDILNNSGVVSGHTDGMVENGTATLNVTNAVGGVISGGVSGIDFDDGSTASQINNAGSIFGGTGRGVFLDEGASAITLINSGTISSSQSSGVDAGSADTEIANSGTISGFNGIYLGGSGIALLHNTGTISSIGAGGFAVTETGSAQFTFINSGSVIGNVDLGTAVGGVYDGTLGSVSGLITADGASASITGGAGVDRIRLNGDGATVDTGAGNDIIYVGAHLSSSTVDGGIGNDTVVFDTAVSGLTLTSDMLANVETLKFTSASSKLSTADDLVAAGQTLTVNAVALTGAQTLNFDGSAETDGRFVVNGGSGNDVIKTGAGNDSINGGAGNDTITSGTGNDILSGGAGVDKFLFTNNAFTAADRVDGGAGNDTLSLSGDYTGSTALTLGATSMVNVETLLIGAGHNYAITTNDANVAAGQTLVVNASALAATNTLTFNGSAEKDGSFKITGGKGADVLTGGKQSDTFVYTSAAQSSSTHYDTINAFNYASDKFDVTGTIGAIDTKVSHTVSTASFDTDIGAAATASHLLGHTAMLVSANAGTLSGHTFLVVDLNGTAGYQAGADLVIDMHGATGTLATTDFI